MMCFLSFSFQCYITCKAYLQQAPDSPQSGQQSSHKCESQPGHSRTLAHDQSAAQQAQASLWHQPSNQGESLWYLWGICDSAGLPEGKTPTKVFIMSFQWSLDAMKLVEQSPLNIFTFAWTFSCNWGFFVKVSDQQSRYFKVICGGTLCVCYSIYILILQFFLILTCQFSWHPATKSGFIKFWTDL